MQNNSKREFKMSEQKYTLQQYAQMQGGHEMEENDKSLSFMQSLGEARMYKSRAQIKSEGLRSITDHAFVSMLSLYAMSQDYDSAVMAKNYAKATIARGSFSAASPGGTDLYQTLFTLNKPMGLVDSAKDKILLNKLTVDNAKIKGFLRKIVNGNMSHGEAQSFFFRLESQLGIQDPKLRAARRLTQNWGKLTTAQRTLVATQLDRYYKTAAYRSDMRPLFMKFAKNNGLIVGQGKVKKIAKRVARGAAAFAAGYAAGKMTEL
jgi:hypothetical protein